MEKIKGILEKEHHELPGLHCPECGRKMVIITKDVVEHSITGSTPKKVAKYHCPSFWCRLINYKFLIVNYTYKGEMLNNGNWKITEEYSGD